MSLSFSEREKLVTTLQKTFPCAPKWDEVKNLKKIYPIKTSEVWGMFIGTLVLGALTFGAFAWSYHLSPSNGATLFEFLTFGAGLVLSVFTLTFTGFSLASLFNAYETKKLKNKNVEYKKMVRDYVAQKTSVRKVREILPQLSDNDLKLLYMHPNLNSVFKKPFEEDFKRREALKTVEKINAEFLTPPISVEQNECKPINIASIHAVKSVSL